MTATLTEQQVEVRQQWAARRQFFVLRSALRAPALRELSLSLVQLVRCLDCLCNSRPDMHA